MVARAGGDDDEEMDVFRELWDAIEACRAAAPEAFGRVESWTLALMVTVKEQAAELRRLRGRIKELESERK